MNNEKRIKEIIKTLNQLEDEYESLCEEQTRLDEDSEEYQFNCDQLMTLEATIGGLEEELELLR